MDRFLLAALESGNADTPFGVNVDKGGQGARIVVVPRYPASDIASLRQFGIGLAIAIVIDATLVRLVLLPAALHLAGRAAWWTPNLGVEHATPMPAKLAWEAPTRGD